MKKIIAKYLRGIMLKAMTGLAGFQLMLAKVIFDKVAELLGRWYLWAKEQHEYHEGQKKIEEANKENKDKAKKHEETLKDGATEEAERDAATDILNGGRKL